MLVYKHLQTGSKDLDLTERTTRRKYPFHLEPYSTTENLSIEIVSSRFCVAQAAIFKPYSLCDVQWNFVQCHEQIWLLTCPVFTFLLSCKHLINQCCCSAWFQATTMCKERFKEHPIGFKWPNAILFYLCCRTSAPFSLTLSSSNKSHHFSFPCEPDLISLFLSQRFHLI